MDFRVPNVSLLVVKCSTLWQSYAQERYNSDNDAWMKDLCWLAPFLLPLSRRQHGNDSGGRQRGGA